MSSSPGPDERRQRLHQLAADFGVASLPPLQLLPRPAPSPMSPSFRGSNDEVLAEELLKRRRLTSADKNPKGIKRAFTTSKRTWEPQEVFETLDAHVSNGGSPGVAEALIAKLMTAGGDLNVAFTKSKTNLLTRRKSMESFERSRILQKAVDNGQVDMVTVLVQHADSQALSTALPAALRAGNVPIAELLLQHGADASATADGQDAFRQLCIVGGQAHLVGLVLQSNGRPAQDLVSTAMVDATRQGCLETVIRLSRSTADGSHDSGAALREAVKQSRVDVALAILTGAKPPNGQCLLESFQVLFDHPTIMPNQKLYLTEGLLCAGAAGDTISAALVQACETEFYEMVHLLMTYGASVEYQDAAVLRSAIKKGQGNLVQLLLNEKTSLSPLYACECVEQIPKRISPEERHSLLSILLRKGAGGPPVHDALINAVEAGDLESIKLLTTPHFPGGRLVESHDIRKGPRGMVYDRHETASVDHKDGLALQIAVMERNIPAVKQLLTAKPSLETLEEVFPSTRDLSPIDRYDMIECFLAGGLSGPVVSAALQEAIEENPPRRDERLIKLFLDYDADVNFNDGAGILSAITHRDLNLLQTLLKKRPNSQTTATALSEAMAVDERPVRYNMMGMLLEAGAGREGEALSEALVNVVQTKPVDTKLLDLLLERGHPDADYKRGLVFFHAIHDSDPGIIESLMIKSKPSPETLTLALSTLSEMPTTPTKAAKVNSILSRSKQSEAVNDLLVREVISLLKVPADKRVYTVLKSLLSSGADVNAFKAAALCHATAAANIPITDLLFAAKPNQSSLAAALPHAIHIADPMDRLSFTRRVLDAGAPPMEANRALNYAVTNISDDVSLIKILADKADSSDGEALLAGVRKELPDIVTLVLRCCPKKYPAAVLDKAFVESTKAKDPVKRSALCTALLQIGISPPAISEALLVAAGVGDLALVRILMNSGASLEHKDGQAVVESSKAGSAEVLRTLLRSTSNVQKKTLEMAFQAATEAGDLKRRAEVFRLLLEKGVTGNVVDAQLVSAARYGDDGMDLVRLLLDHGADVNYNSGEAVRNATRSAFMGSLKMMLGIETSSVQLTKPSNATLVKALKASWKLSKEPRYQAIAWLFQAGLSVSEDIHVTLNKIVVGEDPDPRLIELLLQHGASPLSNGCQTLIDACQKQLLDIVVIFLRADIPEADLSWAFKHSFSPELAQEWLSERGVEIAKALLDKGAKGDGLNEALAASIDAYGSDKDAAARQLVDLLGAANADVNHEDGLMLQKATRRGDVQLIQQLLRWKPNTRSVSLAFSHIFDLSLPEEDVLGLILLFTEYHDGEERLDVMFSQPDSEPILFRAVSQFPRSAKVLQALLDAGFYHDQMIMARVMPGVFDEDEQVSLLFWALLQPQKKVSSNVIELLIQRGAKANFETRITKLTPLMLAIQSRRPDLVRALLLEGAEVDVVDITGNTPLTMATQIGGDVGTSMMTNILAADPSKNDGSLHNAAKELNLDTIKVLIDFGHDVDFPSPLHGGRSALGELCLNATQAGKLPAAQEKKMEKAMAHLLEKGTDVSLQCDGKSPLLLALESADPVTTTKALLKVGLWKHINSSFNHYTDGTYTYSPTQYVSRVLPRFEAQPELLTLLKANRAIDVYYANDGPQPEGAINLPEELLRAERERRARQERIQRESEDHARALAQTQELATIQDQIFKKRAELEAARIKQHHADEIAGVRAKGALQDEMFAAELQRRRAERDASLAHEHALAQAGVARSRLVAGAEIEAEDRRQQQALTWERAVGDERVGNAERLSAVKVRERGDIDRIDAANDARAKARLLEQRKLVETQDRLAGTLTSAGVPPRRQIGYIAGELN